MKQQIPNALTIARYAVLPLLVAAWYVQQPWLTFGLVLAACITDFFDGYLARKWKVESELGRLLDPNADKLLVAVALMLLAVDGAAPVVAVAIILCRELFVSGLREFMAEKGITLHVTKLAKWKTTTQMLAVLWLLMVQAMPHAAMQHSGEMLLWLATLLTVLTGFGYWKAVWRYLSSGT